jgi:hypothetical protein
LRSPSKGGLTGWSNRRKNRFSRPEGLGGSATGNRLDVLACRVLMGFCGQEQVIILCGGAVWTAGLPGRMR